MRLYDECSKGPQVKQANVTMQRPSMHASNHSSGQHKCHNCNTKSTVHNLWTTCPGGTRSAPTRRGLELSGSQPSAQHMDHSHPVTQGHMLHPVTHCRIALRGPLPAGCQTKMRLLSQATQLHFVGLRHHSCTSWPFCSATARQAPTETKAPCEMKDELLPHREQSTCSTTSRR